MKLIELDLTKGEGHKHPDIKTDGRQYLVALTGCNNTGTRFYAGSFTKEWYGLNFTGWVNHLQYDKPGTNCSRYERIWEIIDE